MSGNLGYDLRRDHALRLLTVSLGLVGGGFWAALEAPTNLIFRWEAVSVAIGVASIIAGGYMVATYTRMLLSSENALDIQPAGLVIRCANPYTVVIDWDNVESVSASDRFVVVRRKEGAAVRVPVAALRRLDGEPVEPSEVVDAIEQEWNKMLDNPDT